MGLIQSIRQKIGASKEKSSDKSVDEGRVKIGDKKYLIHSDDNYLQHIGGEFEPDMVKLFQTVAADSGVILDIGANIGCTALLFSEMAKTVHAFEPSPTSFAYLQKNIAQAKRPQVHLHNIGLGSEAGEYPLTFSPDNRSGGFVSNQIQASADYVVEKIVIKRLDDFAQSLDLTAIDFIKIDVEGFEGHVLRGGAEIIKVRQPIVVLELNHWCLNAFQRTSVPDFFDFLRNMFPILLAVNGVEYRDLYNPEETYEVMYYHILRGKFPNLLAAFEENQISRFRNAYRHGFSG